MGVFGVWVEESVGCSPAASSGAPLSQLARSTNPSSGDALRSFRCRGLWYIQVWSLTPSFYMSDSSLIMRVRISSKR